MRSFILVGATLAASIAEASYTTTVIDISTITVYSCGPDVSCTGHHSSTSTLVVNSATSPAEVATTTPCETTLSTVEVPSVVVPGDTTTSISVAIPPTSYEVPTTVAETSGPVASVPVEVSSSVVESAPPAPTTVTPGVTGPTVLNGTSIVPTSNISTGILTASSSPVPPITSTSVVVLPSKSTTGSAPSSSAPAPNAAGRMIVPTVMLGLLALGGYIFA